MNRPSAFTFAVGNTFSCLALLFVAGVLAYQWWTHQETASWFVPLISLFIASTAIKANTEVSSYRAWKREYDDIATGGKASLDRARNRKNIRNLIAFIIWAILGLWLYENAANHASVEYYAIGAYVFVLINAALLYRLFRAVFAAKPRRATRREQIVAITLPKPKSSPRGIDVLKDLPQYCQRLLRVD